MIKNIFGITVATLLLFLQGCVMEQKPYAPIGIKKSKAVVYVYRPESFVSRGLPWSFIINGGKSYTPLINNGYIPIYVNPGNVNIELKQNDTLVKSHLANLSFFAKVGKIYYIKAIPHPFYHYDLILMDKKIAQKEIKDSIYFVPEK